MSTFPPELLIEIFSRVCEPPRGSLDSATSDIRPGRQLAWTESRSNIHNPSPFFLGKICRTWRELVWSSPRLWTYIHLVILPGRCISQAELLDDYIGRSMQLPLTIVFRVMECDNRDVERSFDQVLPLYRMIMGESHRWDTIDLFVPGNYSHLLDSICLSRSMIRRASIHQRRGAFIHEFIHRSLRLQELSLKNVSFSSPPSPYLSLTHLSASSTTVHGLRDLLRNVPNLRWCSLHTIVPFRYHTLTVGLDPVPANMPFHMMHLETFIIRSCPWRVVADILSSIKFQRPFREFRITSTTLTQELFNIIRRRVSPAACSLQVLELGSEWFNIPSNIIAGLGVLLQRSRSVTSLIMTFRGYETLDTERIKTIADLLDPVWPPEPLYCSSSLDFSLLENRVLAPKLQHLELRMDKEGPSIAPILMVLRLRWMFGSSLHSDGSSTTRNGAEYIPKCTKIVSVRLPESYRWEASEYLGDAIREGMIVEFGVNSKLLGV
ncbi:hypothetical protein CVT25_009406 [Psilocybe cyanescens]|uniref:F-box domain-containing protein n=1 Tax=Psilocybe cyanescens TaxID=93625 RepID=A0A409WW22_PSICY|nr:hypothetical protein CVT25_009406 [Psilocybe cyanescens]